MKITTLRWVARISALLVLLLGLPFYFGYGNPLPFLNPEYSFYDNLWLSIFPIMFIGLAISWWSEIWGGRMVVISITVGIALSVLMNTGFSVVILVPFFVGVLYLILGNKNPSLSAH